MKRLSNRTIGIDQGVAALFSDFETGGEMWTGSGPREKSVAVAFSESFLSPPSVHLSLSLIDIDRRHNQRMDLSARKITATGFEIVCRTWDDTRIARVRVAWMAVGEARAEDDWVVG